MGEFKLQEEEKSFIGEMDLDSVKQYKEPFAVIMSGLPGSGKTHMARTMSKELKIFLLSNDLIRNYYYEKLRNYSEEIRKAVQRGTISQNNRREFILLMRKISFVMDRDFNDLKDIKITEGMCLFRNMQTYKILINSPNHEENLRRIANRHYDLDYVIPGVVGDNVAYGARYGEQGYYNAIKRKPRNIDGIKFDYVIDNIGSIEQFDVQIGEVVEDIKNKHTR